MRPRQRGQDDLVEAMPLCGAAQTLGLRPDGGIQPGGQTAQGVSVKAVNGCAGAITVGSVNLTIVGFK